MAVVPNFIFGPNALLSLFGLVHGPDPTSPTPPEDWREARVDVVIPALNEEANIAFCLAALARQTLKPHRIILVDDGSTDRTLEAARAYSDENGLGLITIPRVKPIGKTPTVKRQSREFDGDVEFVLDADTVLESPDYLARCVEELYKARGIASASGRIAPVRLRDRAAWMQREDLRRFREAHPDLKGWATPGPFQKLLRGISNIYRTALHAFVECFIQRGQMSQFGSVLNPAGCAVAYRRRYIKDLFDRYEPIFGDDLTRAEDIFIGMALLNEGYRNVQLEDVRARSPEPTLPLLPAQRYRWTGSFFRSCVDMDGLLLSPFKAPRRRLHERKVRRSGVMEKRKIREPYRQCWGQEYTHRFGRPIGSAVLFSVFEKAAWPAALAVLAGLGMWRTLLYAIGAECLLTTLVLFCAAREDALLTALQGLLATPLRYLALIADLLALLAFPFRRPPNTKSWQPARL
jgi:glycosyltransferase involved in cell wall biosynthesis